MTIEERHAELAAMVEHAVGPGRETYTAEQIMAKARAVYLAVLEECWQASHNEYGYVGEVEFAVALNTVRAQIAPQPHGEHAEPPQQEG